MRNLIDRLVNDTDIVIFDSPPLNSVADAAILASRADGTLFVIDTRRTPTAAVRMASEALSRSGARVLGATLNNRSIDATVGTGYYQRYSESDQQSGLAGGASTVEGRG
jgi:Mrp family chromosome partitioning ATPase